MSVDSILDLARSTMAIGFWVTLPILAIGMAIGIGVAIFQAATQIQESSLSFLPKLIGVGVGLIFFGPWILNKLITFTVTLFTSAASMGR
jgi:flagellar biosynthesis protein FliQ